MKTTAQTAHTAGPWRSGDMFHTIFGPPTGNPAPEVIATIERNFKANARLIAAAPEMLEALKTLRSIVADAHPDAESLGGLEEADAAIAKAEGRSS